MVEISRDGKRVYVPIRCIARGTSSSIPTIKGWLAKIDASADGGITLDPAGFVSSTACVRTKCTMEGGDASSDSYCFA